MYIYMNYRRVQISTQRPWALEHVHIKVVILAYISAYQGYHIIKHIYMYLWAS